MTNDALRPEDLARGMVGRLSPELRARLAPLCSETRVVEGRRLFSTAQERLDESVLLLDGLMGRYVRDKQGRQQMVAIQVPLDFVDLHSFPLGSLDHEVEALTTARLAVFPHETLRAALRDDYELMEALWRLTLIDGAIHRHWTFRLGRLRALAGIANFLAEMDCRMRIAGVGEEGGYALPLTQPDLSDACGMSPVHVNRILRELREAEICTLAGGHVQIMNRDKLYRTGDFRQDFLYDIL
ncbi:Crp/Fnr family transcriptional regulator [Pseudoroseicyclus tamaricis]|uniref:Crp/Fnr family transcriptional regulator n=1 Tax=Pseudoroseicyclus tamaricis TaxID=2705421 RepID=A0A6B2JK31_9RHOB|nr:Crp/Fnr family transcriptional regulator [Pseudoroseicyclus tamaricis]NDV01821.1 Crp/Fnr family transcriptional regulator [Pseudoroseicyclus tamaricis]